MSHNCRRTSCADCCFEEEEDDDSLEEKEDDVFVFENEETDMDLPAGVEFVEEDLGIGGTVEALGDIWEAFLGPILGDEEFAMKIEGSERLFGRRS